MSKKGRHIVHAGIVALNWYLLLVVFKDFEFLVLFFVTNLFAQYVLLSPNLEYAFWSRFALSIIFFGLTNLIVYVLAPVLLVATNSINGMFVLSLFVYLFVSVMLYGYGTSTPKPRGEIINR